MTTKNKTILITWKNVTFSENIFAWFECEMPPVFSNKIEDLMIPKNFYHNNRGNGVYEIYNHADESYLGRLYVPKNYNLE